MQLDWNRARAILDYRAAKSGLEMIRSGSAGLKRLEESPAIADLLIDIQRTHNPAVTTDEFWRDAAEEAATSDQRTTTEEF